MMNLKPTQKPAPRIPRKIWQVHIEEQSQCNQSEDAYCQQKNLSVNRFRYWKNELRKEQALSPFVPAIIEQSKSEVHVDDHVTGSKAMPPRFCSIEFGQNSRLVIESHEAMGYVMGLIERKL